MEIKEIVMKRIMDDAEEIRRSEEPREVFHSSSLGFCERQLFLNKIGVKEWEYNIKSSMQVGSIIHYFIQGLPEVRENFFIEVPIKFQIDGTPIYIVGSADLVKKDRSKIIDIKSAKSLLYLQASPMYHHIPQILMYMKGLGIMEGELLYVDKSNLDMVSHIINFDENLYNETIQKVIRVYNALKEWENAGAFNRPIPFPRCKNKCYFCETEKIKKEFEALIL